MPATIAEVHGSILIYSTCQSSDGTADTRQLFHLLNLRLEIEQQSFVSDPFSAAIHAHVYGLANECPKH